MSIGYEYGASNRTFIAADHDIMFLRSYFEESMRIHEAQNQELAELRTQLAEERKIHLDMQQEVLDRQNEVLVAAEKMANRFAEAQVTMLGYKLDAVLKRESHNIGLVTKYSAQVAMLRNLLERIRDDDRSSLDLDDYKDLLRYLAATQPKG